MGEVTDKVSVMTALPIEKVAAATRNRRSQDSRGRLLAAARKLFVERGYDATRPQDISREAGLGHGTFYLHFADKQACFLVFVEEARAELGAHIRAKQAGATTLESAVRASLEGTFEYTRLHPGVLPTAMMDASVIAAGEARAETLIDVWARQWAGAVKLQGGRKIALDDDEAGIIGAAVVGIIHEGSTYARRHGKPPERTIEILTDMITKALR